MRGRNAMTVNPGPDLFRYVSLTNLDVKVKLLDNMRVNRNFEKNRENFLRIGEFAKLVGCSVVSLRYYEEIGAP